MKFAGPDLSKSKLSSAATPSISRGEQSISKVVPAKEKFKFNQGTKSGEADRAQKV
jgi:hypothetical protein